MTKEERERARLSAYYANNRARIKERRKARYHANKEKERAACAAYRRANLEKERARLSEFRLEHRARYTAYQAKRRAAKLQRTPVWSETKQIRALYECAARLTKCLQTEFHLDHVLPIQGQLVSGLHVVGNLQIITATANCRKRNYWKPEDGA